MCKQQIAMIAKTCINTISRCLKHLDLKVLLAYKLQLQKPVSTLQGGDHSHSQRRDHRA